MKSGLLFLLCFAFPIDKNGKYDDDINAFRQHYKEEFLTDKNSPLKKADTSFLRFYEPDEKYKVTADVTITKDAQPFKIQTHSKKEKDYKEYAVLKFKLKGKNLVLHAYQNVGWEKIPTQKDIMFIPFTDETNNKETYGGGRYIDLDAKDIKDGKIVLDFNKCYNPYCAFAEGYSCPIPPRENSLEIGIKAGEKLYGKEIK